MAGRIIPRSFALLLLILLAALLTMRVGADWAGLDRLGLSARSVSGSVWRGRFVAARLGALDLGDVDAWISPWALLAGRTRIGFAGGDGIEGELSLGNGRYRIDCRVSSPRLDLAGRLVQAGFNRREGGYALILEGELRGERLLTR